MSDSMPPLPEPRLEDVDYELWGQNAKMDCFDADQMHAYARAYAEQETAKLQRERDGFLRGTGRTISTSLVPSSANSD